MARPGFLKATALKAAQGALLYGAGKAYRGAINYVGRVASRRLSRRRKAAFVGGRINKGDGGVLTQSVGGRRRSRRMRSFARKVRSVLAGDQQLQTYCIDNSGAVTTVSLDQISSISVMLGGTTVTTGSNDEILEVMKTAYGLATAADLEDEALHFQSMCIDIDMQNTGTNPVILDIYELVCRQNYATGDTIDAQFNAAFADQAGSGTVSNCAVTPFQNPVFLQYWKIRSHKTVNLRPTEVCSLQKRVNKRKRVQGKLLTTHPQAIPWFTIGYFIQMRGSPVNSTGIKYGTGTICWKARKTLSYKFPVDKAPLTTKTV